MKQTDKDEINNQAFKLTFKDLSISSPVYLTPAVIAATMSIILLCGAFFSENFQSNTILQTALIIAGLILAIAAIQFFTKSLKPEIEGFQSIVKSEIEESQSIAKKDGLNFLKDAIFVTSNQEILHEFIKESFATLKNGEEAFQTYIGAFPISGSRDLIDEVPNRHNVKIERLFGITSPYEINFLSSSEEKRENLIGQTSGKHRLKNRMFHVDLPEIGFKHIVNLTQFNDYVLVTFKTRKPSLYPDSQFDIKRRFPPLFADSTTTFCVGIDGGEASKLVKSEYLNKIIGGRPGSVDKIKRDVYEANSVEYLIAIGYSVAKEVSFLDEFNPYSTDNKGVDKLGYVGIVGSLAEVIKSEMYSDNKKVNDIDLLLFISSESLNSLPDIYEAANKVAKRYSIEGVLDISVDKEMRPRFGRTDGDVSIQIIINDYTSEDQESFVASMKPSNFTMATRLHCNISLFGDLSDFYQTQDIQYIDVIDEIDCFSVINLINIVENRKIFTRFWDQKLKIMKEEPRNINHHESKDLYNYCVKWGLINLYFALKGNRELYGVSFDEMITQMSKLLCISELKTNKVETKGACLSVLNIIKSYAKSRVS